MTRAGDEPVSLTSGSGWLGPTLALALILWSGAAHPAPPPEVARNFHWLVPPRVRICDQSDLSEQQVRQAMDWWTARGARFRELVVAPCAFSADGIPLNERAAAPDYNTISIARLGQLSFNGKAGDTRWAAQGDLPLWALVVLPRGPVGALTLQHELGHALGFPHVTVRGNIMNPLEDQVGESTAGLDPGR